MNLKLSLIIFLLLANLAVWPGLLGTGKTEVDVFSIGFGDAILIQKGSTQVLIDSGPDSKVVGQLAKYMPAGDRTIDAFILTHPHLDHFSGLPFVMDHYGVGSFISTGEGNSIEQFNQMAAKVRTANTPIRTVMAGQTINVGAISLQVLYPFTVKNDKSHNSSSLVMKTVLDGHSFLLTGDVEGKSEPVFDQTFAPDLAGIEVLKVAHHGSGFSSTANFLKLVRPKYAVISVGRNPYGLPAAKTVSNIAAQTELFRTDKDGTVRFEITGGKLVVNHG